jgi:multicomponent Na+:H+ antiporter subunit E
MGFSLTLQRHHTASRTRQRESKAGTVGSSRPVIHADAKALREAGIPLRRRRHKALNHAFGQSPAVLARATGFFVVWLALSGADPADLPAAAVAVAAATWASLRLLPPGAWRVSAIGLARLALRFPRQSVVAGVDVAWRALHPRLPLRPGLVSFPSRLPPGTARNAFCTLTSLLPGTLPVGSDAGGALLVHCLDVGQRVVAQLQAEEALFLRALDQ